MTTIFVAYKRVRFDSDEVLGVFLDRDRAEQAIAEYLIKLKLSRAVEDLQELLFSLAATFEVDSWETDSIERKDNYGLTDHLLGELVTKIEKQ